MKLDPRLVLLPVAMAAALLWCGVLAATHLQGRASVLDRPEASLADLRTLLFGRRSPPGDVAIVAIDDEAVRRAGRFPVPRGLVGTALDRLFAAGAKAVVLDLLFLDPAEPADDRGLIKGLAAGRTAVAAFLNYPAPGSIAEGTGVVPCERPFAALLQATADGVANIALDPSGIARHLPTLLPCAGGVLPALALRGAAFATGADPAFTPDAVLLGAVATPLDLTRAVALRYYGPEGTFPTVSLAAVLDGRTGDSVRGRTVALGATAQGVGDRYPTPFDTLLPGVEIIATGIANLETGDALDRRPWVRRTDAACAFALGLAVVGAVLAQNVTVGLAAFGALLAAWLTLVLVGFAHGVWFAMAMPLAAVVPLGVVAGVGRLAADRWSEQRLRRQQAILGAFQSPAMLARMLDDPGFMAEPVERTVAVLFIDISGYTGLSEKLDPRAARDLLKQWHEIVEAGAAAGGGIVAAFMADGAMLVWGMVESRPDDARRAVETALALAEQTQTWLDAAAPAPDIGQLGIKVGGHYGPAILSRLGDVTHQHITAIGDTVNVASRLMAAAKHHEVPVALSADLLAEAERRGFTTADRDFAPAEPVAIRGRTHPVMARLSRTIDAVVRA